jgi:hypothetical protein
MRARPPQHHLNQRPSFAQHSCEQLCLSIPLRTTSRPPLCPIASRVLEQAHHPCDLTRLLAAEAGAFGPNQTVCRLPAAGWAPGRILRSCILVFATVVVRNIPFLPPDDIAPSAPAPPVACFEYKNKLTILANFTRLLTVKVGDFSPSQETSVGCRQQVELRVEYCGRVPGVCDGRGDHPFLALRIMAESPSADVCLVYAVTICPIFDPPSLCSHKALDVQNIVGVVIQAPRIEARHYRLHVRAVLSAARAASQNESGLLLASIASKARVGWSTLQLYRCKGELFLVSTF